MAIGRGLGNIRGAVSLTTPMVVTSWKGMLVLKGLSAGSGGVRALSPLASRSGILLREFSSRWMYLTELQRAKWEALAKELGSAYLQERRITSGQAGHIIPRQGVLMKGCHLYTRSNVLAATSNLSYPRDEAPLPTSIPPSPMIYAKLEPLDGRTALICTIDDTLRGMPYYAERVLRIWLCVYTNGVERHGGIEAIIPLPLKDNIPNGRDPEHHKIVELGKIAFTGFRGTAPFGNRWVEFDELDTARIRVECENIVADAPYLGVVRSAPSNLEELYIAVEETPERRALKEQLRKYTKEKSRRHYYRTKAFSILSAQLGEKLLKGENIGEEIMKVMKA